MTARNLFISVSLIWIALIGSLVAQDVAVFEFQVGNDKKDLKTVVIELDPQAAPQTVENFKKLVRKGFYKKQRLHRIIPNYLVQLGDPESRDLDSRDIGTNGPGYTLPPEITQDHEVGSVAMARLPDNVNPARRSNGSQFYFALDDMDDLDGKYTVFGRVISGLEHVKSFSTMAVDSNDMPVTPVQVRRVYMADRAEVLPAAAPVES